MVEYNGGFIGKAPYKESAWSALKTGSPVFEMSLWYQVKRANEAQFSK